MFIASFDLTTALQNGHDRKSYSCFPGEKTGFKDSEHLG